ncbi:MAG: DUF4282 domain-containing protein [Sphingomonadales bacterium]|nr:MAG: DUF4282 domain-containing protein [Sphingomonadales bacterium]
MTDERNDTSAGGIIKRFLSFDDMIGSSLIKFIYYAGLVGVALYTLVLLFAAVRVLDYSPSMFLVGLLSAAFCLIAGTVMWRFTCELWILLFRIFERLGEIRDRLPPR